MDISVIVPLLNEEESLPELTTWIERVMNDHQFSYEVIMVDDGSTDRSWEVIESLHKKSNTIYISPVIRPKRSGMEYFDDGVKSVILWIVFKNFRFRFTLFRKSCT